MPKTKITINPNSLPVEGKRVWFKLDTEEEKTGKFYNDGEYGVFKVDMDEEYTPFSVLEWQYLSEWKRENEVESETATA